MSFAPLTDQQSGRVSTWGATQKAAYVVLINPTTGLPYVASGGGGGGGGFFDLLFTDDTGTLFVYRDDGTGAAMSAFAVPAGTAYTVGANPRPWSPATQAVTGPLTDAQLRATAVPVSGPLTDAQLRATAVPVSGPLTDAQLRATAVPVSGPLTSGDLEFNTGALTAKTQRVTLATDGPLVTAVGQQADAAATTDTGTFSVIAFIKRGLQNWTTLLARIPAQNVPNLVPVDTLGTPGTARSQATSGTAANIALTTTCRRVSMTATAATFYSISGTATSSSHYIGAGERLDFDVPASTTISVLQVSAAGTVYVTELT